MTNSRFFYPETARSKPLVAVSACLTGENVRYDGASKPLPTATGLLAQALCLTPICPEVGAGLSIPRPPVQLVNSHHQLQALGRDDPQLDVTETLNRFTRTCMDQLATEPLCGYILKSRSPSCGLESTPIVSPSGEQLAIGNGLHADAFRQRFPWIVYRDETQLETTEQCHVFILLCQLVDDLLSAIRHQQLPQAHQHFSFLHTQLGSPCQQHLQQALLYEEDRGFGYITIFKNGVEQCEGLELQALLKNKCL